MAKVVNYKEIIESLGYRPVARLNRRQSSYAVYKAISDFQDGNGQRDRVIVKLISDGNDSLPLWDPRASLIRERDILQRFQGLNGIPEVLDFYDENSDSGEMVLVRRYIPGKVIHFGDRIKGTKIQQIAEEIVRELHDNGFAGLNLVSENLVLSKNNPHIIDVGSAISLSDDEISIRRFSELAYRDLRDLESLCD